MQGNWGARYLLGCGAVQSRSDARASPCAVWISSLVCPCLGAGQSSPDSPCAMYLYMASSLVDLCTCSLPESALEEFNFYLDTQRLRIAVSNMKNANQRAELEDIKVDTCTCKIYSTPQGKPVSCCQRQLLFLAYRTLGVLSCLLSSPVQSVSAHIWPYAGRLSCWQGAVRWASSAVAAKMLFSILPLQHLIFCY